MSWSHIKKKIEEAGKDIYKEYAEEKKLLKELKKPQTKDKR